MVVILLLVASPNQLTVVPFIMVLTVVQIPAIMKFARMEFG